MQSKFVFTLGFVAFLAALTISQVGACHTCGVDSCRCVDPGLALQGLSTLGSLGSLGSIGSLGSLGSIGSLGSGVALGSIGTLGSGITVGSLGGVQPIALGGLGGLGSLGSVSSVAVEPINVGSVQPISYGIIGGGNSGSCGGCGQSLGGIGWLPGNLCGSCIRQRYYAIPASLPSC